MTSTSRRLAAAATLVVLLATGACGTTRVADDDALPTEIVGHALTALPAATSQDWATYGDKLAVVTVTSEDRIAAPAEEIKRGEGHVMRKVTLAVAAPTWTRPTFTKGPPIPSTLTLTNGGWVFHGDQEVRLVLEEDPWMEVGKSYLGVLTSTKLSKTTPSWILLSHTDLGQDGVVRRQRTDARAVSSTFEGKTPRGVAAALDATAPDPRARRFMAVDPVQRWRSALGATAHEGHGES